MNSSTFERIWILNYIATHLKHCVLHSCLNALICFIKIPTLLRRNQFLLKNMSGKKSLLGLIFPTNQHSWLHYICIIWREASCSTPSSHSSRKCKPPCFLPNIISQILLVWNWRRTVKYCRSFHSAPAIFLYSTFKIGIISATEKFYHIYWSNSVLLTAPPKDRLLPG